MKVAETWPAIAALFRCDVCFPAQKYNINIGSVLVRFKFQTVSIISRYTRPIYPKIYCTLSLKMIATNFAGNRVSAFCARLTKKLAVFKSCNSSFAAGHWSFPRTFVPRTIPCSFLHEHAAAAGEEGSLLREGIDFHRGVRRALASMTIGRPCVPSVASVFRLRGIYTQLAFCITSTGPEHVQDSKWRFAVDGNLTVTRTYTRDSSNRALV